MSGVVLIEPSAALTGLVTTAAVVTAGVGGCVTGDAQRAAEDLQI